MEGCDAHVPWTLFLAGGGAEVSDVPQSLLEALDLRVRVSCEEGDEKWFGAHDVVEVVRQGQDVDRRRRRSTTSAV